MFLCTYLECTDQYWGNAYAIPAAVSMKRYFENLQQQALRGSLGNTKYNQYLLNDQFVCFHLNGLNQKLDPRTALMRVRWEIFTLVLVDVCFQRFSGQHS